MNAQIENINNQIATLRAKWRTLAATGKHADAVSLENEISSLERSSVRIGIQQEAEAIEAARARAADAAKPTLEQIEKHRAARVVLEKAIADIEVAARQLEGATGRLEPAFMACAATWPRTETFKDAAQQEAYDEALGAAGRNPNFEPLRLRLRINLVLDLLRERRLDDILARADLARY